MPLPVCTRRDPVRDRRTPLIVATVLIASVLAVATLALVDYRGDLTESEGVTYPGSGTAADPWRFGEHGELRATLVGDTLTVYQDPGWTGGLSDVPDCTDVTATPWADDEVKSKVKNIVIMDGIRSIGSNAFVGFSNFGDNYPYGTIDLRWSDVVLIKSKAFAEGSMWMEVYLSDYACTVAEDAFTFINGHGNTSYNTIYDSSGMPITEITSDIAGSSFSPGAGTLYGPDSPSKKFTTTYVVEDADEGSSPAPTQSDVRAGKKITLAQYNGTKDGLPFKGWQCSSDGQIYKAGHKVAMVEDGLTLTAVFGEEEEEEKTHTVTYELGEGTIGPTPDTISVAEGVEFELAQCEATREGFVFAGWDYLGDTHPAGYKMTMGNENIVLTAVWKEPEAVYTVTFLLNGGEGSFPQMSCHPGDTITISPVEPTKDSCTFDGWYCDDARYSAGQKVIVNSNMTFTAQWKADGGSDKIVPVPIFPGDEQEAIEVVINDQKDDSWLGQNGKTIILLAIVAAIIAELAVLSISRRR